MTVFILSSIYISVYFIVLVPVVLGSMSSDVLSISILDP